ncbi:MAG: CPBP family intramembrane metalloprotease [Candidatus Latescibacteria bacterium]|nr:CPBP family intramembrane metalloprotease [Candidatus Latescibacterota bacterium]
MENQDQSNTSTPHDVFTAVNNYFLLFFCGSCVLSSMYIQQLFLVTGHHRLGIGVSALIGIILPAYLLLRRFPGGPRAQLRVARPRVHRMILVIVATCAAVVLIDQIYVLNQRFSPVPEDYADAIRDLKPVTALHFVVTFAGLCLLVPLAEEIVFRGLIQQVFVRNMGAVIAVLLAGATFGAVHLNAHLLVSITAFGFFLGYIYHVTGNLTYTIVAHAIFNTVAFAQLAFQTEEQASQLPVYLSDVRIVVGALVIFIFLLVKTKEGGPETEPPYESLDR